MLLFIKINLYGYVAIILLNKNKLIKILKVNSQTGTHL